MSMLLLTRNAALWATSNKVYYEKRVIIADFLFLDFARMHGLSYFHSKTRAMEKQAVIDKAENEAFERKFNDDAKKASKEAEQEEKYKTEQLGKGF